MRASGGKLNIQQESQLPSFNFRDENDFWSFFCTKINFHINFMKRIFFLQNSIHIHVSEIKWTVFYVYILKSHHLTSYSWNLIQWKLYARWFHFWIHQLLIWPMPMATIYSCGVWKIFVEIKKLFFSAFSFYILINDSCVCEWVRMKNMLDTNWWARKRERVVGEQENNENYSMLKNLWHSSTWIYQSQQIHFFLPLPFFMTGQLNVLEVAKMCL